MPQSALPLSSSVRLRQGKGKIINLSPLIRALVAITSEKQRNRPINQTNQETTKPHDARDYLEIEAGCARSSIYENMLCGPHTL